MLTDKSSMPDARGSVLIFLKSESFSQSVKMALDTNGYSGTVVTTECLALTEAKSKVPSLIILDHGSGSVVNFRRMSMFSGTPIVAVQDGSISCEDEDCLKEYDQDVDLVVCGQSVRELIARVRAILRRRDTGIKTNTQYHAGNLRMDLDRHEVQVNGHAVDLTPKNSKFSSSSSNRPAACSPARKCSIASGEKAMRSKSMRSMCIFIRCGKRLNRTLPVRRSS